MRGKRTRAARHGAEIVSAGDSALLVRFGTEIAPETSARVMALLRALDREPPTGVRDLVPAYASLLVLFDPLAASQAEIADRVRAAVGRMRIRAGGAVGRLVRIPVEYGGAAGPDLGVVAQLVGLAPEEVVRRHAAAEYRVNFLGFLAGFPYLSGLPSELAVPRLASPRTAVPSGSVGLAGGQTGIYPVTTPGGWRIIGRTSVRLFDPNCRPPALLRPGDRVRFEPVRAWLADGLPSPRGDRQRAEGGTTQPDTAGEPDGVPWLAVRAPGPLTTVQDLGRVGYARYGVSVAGAADPDALRVGNLVLGNPPGAAGLELTLGGGEFEALAPCVVVVTGAGGALYRNGQRVPVDVPLALDARDTLRLGWAREGTRMYLCVAGGVYVALVLGSRATDMRASLGGIDGRPLRAGDVLWRGSSEQPAATLAGRKVPPDTVRSIETSGVKLLRLLSGPHAAEAAGDLELLLRSTFTISPASDRIGVRLHTFDGGGAGGAHRGEMITEGVARGAIQMPPNGEPIILLADHQTTGGYCVPGVVATVDLWRVAQLRPGDRLRFTLVTTQEAVAALRERVAWLEQFAAQRAQATPWRLAGHGTLDTAVLMRGFAEWSDEEERDDD